MIKLNQINILEKITPNQEVILKEIDGECHINGKIYVRKMNKDFKNYSSMMEFKKELCSKVGIASSNALLIFTE